MGVLKVFSLHICTACVVSGLSFSESLSCISSDRRKKAADEALFLVRNGGALAMKLTGVVGRRELPHR